MDNPYRAQSKVNPQRTWRREIATPTFRALLMAGLSAAQYQVVLFIIERTWGFNRKSHQISWADFTQWTQLGRRTVARAIAELETQRVIVVGRNTTGSQVSEYLFNKHWDTWLTSLTIDAGMVLDPSQAAPEAEGTGDKNGTGANADTGAATDTGAADGTDRCQKVYRPVPKSVPTGATSAPEAEPVKKDRKKDRKKQDRKEIEKQRLFDLWNSLQIIQHRELTDHRTMVIMAALQHYTIEELCEAVVNYAKVLHGEEFFWDYRWTLEEFLNRGLEKFLDSEVAEANYRLREPGGMRPGSHKRALTDGGPEDYGITPVMTIVGQRAAKYRHEHHRSPSYSEIQEWGEEAAREIEEQEEKQAAMEAESKPETVDTEND